MADYQTRHVGTAVVAGPPFSRISWGAIIAGAVCAFALQLVLNMIGLAAGFAAIDPATEEAPLSGIATGTGIWWGVSALISLFAGGWVAARLAGVPIRITAALHGVSVWALSVVLAVWLATSAVTSVASGVVGAVSQVGEVAAAAVGGSRRDSDGQSGGGALDRLAASVLDERQSATTGSQTRLQSIAQDIRGEARQVYRQVVSQGEQRQAVDAVEETAQDALRTPGDIGQDLNMLIDRLFSADGVFSEEDKQQAMQIVEERLGISQEEAEQIVDNWQERYQAAVEEVQQAAAELREEATEAAQTATTVLAEASMWTAIALVLGFIAALVGGLVGKPELWATEAVDDVRS